MKLCKRCNRNPAYPEDISVSPCGCSNAYCEECQDPEFPQWVLNYSKLHARVGGRHTRGTVIPCPSGILFQKEWDFRDELKDSFGNSIEVLYACLINMKSLIVPGLPD